MSELKEYDGNEAEQKAKEVQWGLIELNLIAPKTYSASFYSDEAAGNGEFSFEEDDATYEQVGKSIRDSYNCDVKIATGNNPPYGPDNPQFVLYLAGEKRWEPRIKQAEIKHDE